MNTTQPTLTPLHFAQTLNLQPGSPAEPRLRITRPFFETPRRTAHHDMLLLNAHPDLLPSPELPPPRDLTFFNFDRP